MRPAIVVSALAAIGCTRSPGPEEAPEVPTAVGAADGSSAEAGTRAAIFDVGAGEREVDAARAVVIPADAAAGGEPPRACADGEPLAGGCVCREGGACGGVCCPEGVGCEVGTCASARACTDGQSLASGCRCDGRTCIDICCVGSACSHSSGPDGGWPKCVRLPRR